MSLDFKAAENFDQWREQFTNALSGTASQSPGDISVQTMIDRADDVAQRAVLLIQERAKESR